MFHYPVFPGSPYNVVVENLSAEGNEYTAETLVPENVEEKAGPREWPFPRFIPSVFQRQCYLCATVCKTLLQKCEVEGTLIQDIPVCYRCVTTQLDYEIDREAFNAQVDIINK